MAGNLTRREIKVSLRPGNDYRNNHCGYNHCDVLRQGELWPTEHPYARAPSFLVVTGRPRGGTTELKRTTVFVNTSPGLLSIC